MFEQRLAVFLDLLNDIWANQLAVVGNGVVELQHVDARYLGLVAITDLCQRDIAPGLAAYLTMAGCHDPWELIAELQMFQIAVCLDLVSVQVRQFAVIQESNLFDGIQITLRFAGVGTSRRFGYADVARLHNHLLHCVLANGVVIVYLLSTVVPFRSRVGVVARIYLVGWFDLTILQQNHVTYGLEGRTWIHQILKEVVVVLHAMVSVSAQVRDSTYLSCLDLHEGGPSFGGMQFEQTFVQLVVQNLLHLNVQSRVDVGAVNGRFDGDVRHRATYLLDISQTWGACQIMVVGFFQSAQTMSRHLRGVGSRLRIDRTYRGRCHAVFAIRAIAVSAFFDDQAVAIVRLVEVGLLA